MKRYQLPAGVTGISAGGQALEVVDGVVEVDDDFNDAGLIRAGCARIAEASPSPAPLPAPEPAPAEDVQQ